VSDGGGGDWDRRNRLKVYRGLARLLERDIKGAATLLIDCIATFSCNEICSYQSFILYAIMSNLLDLKRPQIKEKLLDGPEVLSVANDIPEVVGDFQAVAIDRFARMSYQLFSFLPLTGQIGQIAL
jgi:26S proteasome regulatory subunit N7